MDLPFFLLVFSIFKIFSVMFPFDRRYLDRDDGVNDLERGPFDISVQMNINFAPDGNFDLIKFLVVVDFHLQVVFVIIFRLGR